MSVSVPGDVVSEHCDGEEWPFSGLVSEHNLVEGGHKTVVFPKKAKTA